MRFKGTILSKRTVALFAAAILLLCSGGFMGVKAEPNVTGSNYDATINLDSIKVTLLENDKNVKENGGKLVFGSNGEIKPHWTYPEKISVENTGAAPEYVRVVVRKYWTKDGKKATDLTPDLISIVSTGDWFINDAETTDEMTVYYCKKQLNKGDTSQLVEAIRIDDNEKIDLDEKTVKTEKDGDTTIYTYIYKYDGYSVNIEAEAQAVQTHNADDAIKSVWGVDNVKASGGSLTK